MRRHESDLMEKILYPPLKSSVADNTEICSSTYSVEKTTGQFDCNMRKSFFFFSKTEYNSKQPILVV